MGAGPADFDTARLGDYLAPRIASLARPLAAERFSGGQSNPTYKITDAAGHRYVLRKKPSGVLLPSAHAIEREYKVMLALAGSAVPVARVHCLCTDTNVIGTPFYVMEHVDGRIFWDPALPNLGKAERAALYDDVNRVVAALHSVDPAQVGLADFGRPGNFIDRQLQRWTAQYRASALGEIPAMDKLIDWLPRHVPSNDATTIFHGDLRIDNMIFHPTEPRVIALLDWELSTLGHPMADFAYHALPWRLKADQFRGMAEHDLAALGIPTEQQYLQRYIERTCRAVSTTDWSFYLGYSLFRLAAILQGIHKRALDGTASSTQALEVGAKAAMIAEAGWAQVQGAQG